MRIWNKRVKYEDRNRALGLCTRSKSCTGAGIFCSTNLCRKCLKYARAKMRASR